MLLIYPVLSFVNIVVNLFRLFVLLVYLFVVQLPTAVVSTEASDEHDDDLHDKCTICLSNFQEDERVRYVNSIFVTSPLR